MSKDIKNRAAAIQQIINPEEFRLDLASQCEECAKLDAPVFMGSGKADAPYIITPAKLINAQELSWYVPVSTGQLKRDFSTARILIRHFDVMFLVMAKTERLIGLSRNPLYDNPAIDRLLHKAPATLGAVKKPLHAPMGELEKQIAEFRTFLSKRLDQIEIQGLKYQDRILTAIEAERQ